MTVTPDNSGTSTEVGSANWSGFQSTTGNTYSEAETDWTIPSATYPTPPGATYESSWAGLGSGASDSAALFQAGTEVDVNTSDNVTIYPWWEFYPENTEQTISNLTIQPGATNDNYASLTHTGSGMGEVEVCTEYDEDWTCIDPIEVTWNTSKYTLDTSQYECIAERPEQADKTWQRLTDVVGMAFSGCEGLDSSSTWEAMGDYNRDYIYTAKTQTAAACDTNPWAMETGDITGSDFPMRWLGYAYPIAVADC